MKKACSLALTILMMFSLPACGGPTNGAGSSNVISPPEDDHSEEVEITLWTYPVGSWGSSSSVAPLLASFHKRYPNIHVSVSYVTYNNDETNGDVRIEEAIANGTLPDLVFEGPERLVADWGDRGLMADLSDLWASETASGIYDSVRAACQHSSGAYYEFPVSMITHCMAINYQMFEDAGALQYLDEEHHTWTTEGFLNAVNALVANGQEQVGLIYCGGMGGDQGTRALVNNLYGGSSTDEEHTRYTWDSEENIRALQTLYDLEGISFDPNHVGVDEISMFANKELAMSFCWNSVMEVSQTINHPDLDFDIFPMAFPTESGDPELCGGIYGFGVFDNGDEAKIQAAKTLIEFMTTDNAQYAKAVLISNYFPVREMPDLYTNDAMMSEYNIFTPYMGSYYQVTAGWSTARTAWYTMLQEIGAGNDIVETVQKYVAQANAAAGA